MNPRNKWLPKAKSSEDPAAAAAASGAAAAMKPIGTPAASNGTASNAGSKTTAKPAEHSDKRGLKERGSWLTG